MDMMTTKQEQYAVTLCRRLFGNKGSHLSQYKRDLASIDFKIRMRGVDKGEASALISDLRARLGMEDD